MLLRFYIFSTVTGCPEAANKRYCDEAFAGIEAAEISLFGESFTNHWDEFYTTLPEEGELSQLKIEKLPALVIYDADRQQALFKLEKDKINQENVMAACITAWRLQPDPNNNTAYVTPSGQTLTAGELLDAKPCPSWIPDFLCNGFGKRAWNGFGLDAILLYALLGLLVFIVYKTLR